MRYVYHFLVFYLTVHILWSIFREKKFWKQAGTALVLILFLLRLFLIQ